MPPVTAYPAQLVLRGFALRRVSVARWPRLCAGMLRTPEASAGGRAFDGAGAARAVPLSAAQASAASSTVVSARFFSMGPVLGCVRAVPVTLCQIS